LTGRPNPTQDALWQVVRRHRRGIFATVGREGLPHLTNVHYLADEDRRALRITTTTTRMKGRNLLRDPRASLHVQDGDDWFAYAVAEGPVTVGVAEEPGDAPVDDLYELFTTFRGPQKRPEFDEKMITTKRLIARLSVDRLYGLVGGP
jgi:PPOX class probable F420-dependent enzyme